MAFRIRRWSGLGPTACGPSEEPQKKDMKRMKDMKGMKGYWAKKLLIPSVSFRTLKLMSKACRTPDSLRYVIA